MLGDSEDETKPKQAQSSSSAFMNLISETDVDSSAEVNFFIPLSVLLLTQGTIRKTATPVCNVGEIKVSMSKIRCRKSVLYLHNIEIIFHLFSCSADRGKLQDDDSEKGLRPPKEMSAKIF